MAVEYANIIPLLPSPLEGSPWYCGKMERTQAEQYLMDVSSVVLCSTIAVRIQRFGVWS